MEAMNIRSRRLVAALAAFGAVFVVGVATAASEDEVGRIIDMEYHHGYVVVQFPTRRMYVTMDKREMGQYAVGDEISLDTFGRPQPRVQPPPRPAPLSPGPHR
jgi:hypothetical protein